MADLSEFTDTSRHGPKPKGQCKVAIIIAELVDEDPDFAKSLLAALEARTQVANASIELVLKRHGKSVSNEVIRKHRIGICACLTK